MSESEGLQKLTAYLNQTRRQAELAVDALNQQIEDLKKENDLYAQLCKKLEQEKEYFRGMVDQLKQGGTTKQMLQERDDWRALIDSVQKDRARLQEECTALEFSLDTANEEIANLRDEMEHLRQEQHQHNGHDNHRPTGTPHRSNTSSPGRRTPLSIQCDHEEDEYGGGEGSTSSSPLVSPILDRNGQEVPLNLSGPPQQVVRQLQLELKRTYAQLATERQQAEADRIAHQMELSRLQDRVGIGAGGRGGAPNSGRTYVLNGLDSSSAGLLAGHGAAGAAGGGGRGGHASAGGSAGGAAGGGGGGWLNPMAYVGYWFGGSGSGGGGGGGGSGGGDTIIIKV